ncbi:DNA polymerase III subunit delta [Companilactobacillus sp. RD055328]|uniref:DNA polymerase III subunit delta n=1 Tax=Companilactobacillus sp. RD055328 TaxID=2916634 RepID=UPI001FC89E4A|nr:DNA polymerase III subunit delta [Companilactobacillus sp. RD055328]GKQ42812.1 DNA polymerase III subunit delta [Companilactobacillus sp. RD055328]
MNLKELQKQLKVKIEPIYMVVGNEASLNDKAIKIFKELLQPEELDMNFSDFDLREDSLEDVINEAISAPFFGDRRLIFVNNPVFLTGEKNQSIEQNVEILSDYIKNPMLSSVLVFFANYEKLDSRKKIVKELNKSVQIIDTAKISANQVEGYAKALITNEGYSIDNDAFDLLIQKTNADFSSIQTNLEKIYLYCLDTKKIDLEAVDKLVPNSLDDNVFDLVNAILNKNTALAEDLYQQMLIQKIEPIALNGLILSQLRLLIQINILSAKGLTQATIASTLKVHPFRVKMANTQAKRFTLDILQEMYQYIVNIDYKMKTGSDNKEMLFDLFIAKFA